MHVISLVAGESFATPLSTLAAKSVDSPATLLARMWGILAAEPRCCSTQRCITAPTVNSPTARSMGPSGPKTGFGFARRWRSSWGYPTGKTRQRLSGRLCGALGKRSLVACAAQLRYSVRRAGPL